MRVQPGQLVSLGHGVYARSEEVVAIQPIVEGRGPGRRTFVWVRGVAEPLVASRGDETIARDLVQPADQVTRLHEAVRTLERLETAIEAVPPVLLRVLEEETGHDFAALAADVRKALA